MSKVTSWQRFLRCRQPFTVISPNNRIMGFTWDEIDGKETWMDHHLGQTITRSEAEVIATTWRAEHVGIYSVT